MKSLLDRWNSSGSVTQFIFETLALLIAVTVPITLLGGGIGLLVCAGVVAIYLTICHKTGRPDHATAQPDPPAARVRFLRSLALLMALAAVGLPPVLAWNFWAFPAIDYPASMGALNWFSFAGTLWLIAGLLLVSLLFGALAVAGLRQDGERIGPCYRRFLAEGGRDAFRSALSCFAIFFGLAGLVSVGGSMPALTLLFETITRHGRYPDWLEVAIAIPTVPIWLFASVVLLVLYRRLNHRAVPAGQPGDARTTKRRGGLLPTGFALLAGAAAILGGIGHVMHIGIFGKFGPVAEIGPMRTVADELGGWVAEQRDIGRSSGEIVAALRNHGRWEPASPDTGLTELMPMLKDEKSYDSIQGSACRFTIEADVADPDELRSVDWLPAEEASQPVKYCLVVACPSPTRWPEDSTLSLFSSHSSQNRYWQDSMFVDLFGRGPAEAGGYCTTTGALADRFQG